jgi:allophanate hydrolase
MRHLSLLMVLLVPVVTPICSAGMPPGGADMAAQSVAQFQVAIQRLTAAGGVLVPIDFTPFAKTAALLYQSSFVAERYSGLRKFLDAGSSSSSSASAKASSSSSQGPEAALAQQRQLLTDDRLLPVTRTIICGAGEAAGYGRRQ